MRSRMVPGNRTWPILDAVCAATFCVSVAPHGLGSRLFCGAPLSYRLDNAGRPFKIIQSPTLCGPKAFGPAGFFSGAFFISLAYKFINWSGPKWNL